MLFGLFGEKEKPRLGYYSQNKEDAQDNKKLLAQEQEVLSRIQTLNQNLKAGPARAGITTTQGEEGLWIGG